MEKSAPEQTEQGAAHVPRSLQSCGLTTAQNRARAAASCTSRGGTHGKSSHTRESTGQWGSKNLHMTD